MRWVMVVRGLAGASMVAAVAGFYLPWALIDLREPELVKQLRATTPLKDTLDGLSQDLGRIAVTIRRGAQTITGDLPSIADIPKQVSGAQIPQRVRQDNAQLAVAVLELLIPSRQHLEAKSLLVYLVPGLALLGGFLLCLLGGRAVVVGVVGGLCAAIAAVGFWKLLTTNTTALFIAVTIGRGLWLSLWAYVGLAAASGIAVLSRAARKPSAERPAVL